LKIDYSLLLLQSSVWEDDW